MLRALLGCWAIVLAACSAAAQPVPEGFARQPAGSLARLIEPAPLAPGHSPAAQQARLRAVADSRAWVIETGPLPVPSSAASNTGAPQEDWHVLLAWRVRLRAEADARHYRLLSHRNDVWYGSTYWAGPDWTRVGKDWHHPGEKTPAVRRFDVPRDGRVTIAGRVAKYHLAPNTDGVRVTIRHNSREVWQAELAGGDGQGVEPQITLDVRKGDRLRFVVHKRRQIYCDTTRWDPVVRYEDGETFFASAAFSTTEQGHGGWFYEMETGDADTWGLPRLWAVNKDLTLCESPLAEGQTIVCDDRSHWPLLVLADALDQSGVALAMPPAVPWRFSAHFAPKGKHD